MSAAWKKRPEAGTGLGIRVMVRLALLLGRRGAQFVIAPVALYFLLVRTVERRASRKFLSVALGRSATWLDVYRHFYTFARVTVDRVYFAGGRSTAVPVAEFHTELLEELSSDEHGGIFLAAHMGSFEVARSIASDQSNLLVRIVLDRAVNKRFIEMLESFSPQFAAGIIDLNQHKADLGVVIAQSLQKGGWVGFLADRYMPGDRFANVRFFERRAKLPLGPFIIGAVLHSRIVCVFTVYREGRYEVYCEELSDRLVVPRKNREEELAALVQQYAGRLEHYARLAPYSWFNFYDFWEDAE